MVSWFPSEEQGLNQRKTTEQKKKCRGEEEQKQRQMNDECEWKKMEENGQENAVNINEENCKMEKSK